MKVDWIIHVFNCTGSYGLRNSHTHGMENHGHLDFQCVLPLSPELISYALNRLGLRVQNGEHFHDGQILDDLFESPPVRLDKVIEDGREVLRVIFQDPQYLWPEDERCQAPYKYQVKRVFEDDSDYPCVSCRTCDTCSQLRRNRPS